MASRTPALALLVLAALAGCAQQPRDVVLQLDTDARRYRSQQCRDARTAALNYRDHGLARAAVGLVGNLIVPVAGSAAALAMGAERNRERERLNERIGQSCLADPVNERRQTRTPRRPTRR